MDIARLGVYRSLSPLGVGMMGEVFLGYHDVFNRPYAIKCLHHNLAKNPIVLERFMREAEHTSKLHHPHIVRVLDSGSYEGLHFLVMEYVDGPTLQRLQETQTLTTHEAVRFAYQIAHALDYAHRNNVIHRDVKPDNVLITKSGFAKLSDFGLLRVMGQGEALKSKLTAVGMAIGTPYFMAPEQWRNEAVDHRSDVYGLGATLFYLLSGSYPYAGETPLDVAQAQMDGRREPLRHQSASLISLVSSATARDPARRFQTMKALIQAFEHWWLQNPSLDPMLELDLAPSFQDPLAQTSRSPITLGRSAASTQRIERDPPISRPLLSPTQDTHMSPFTTRRSGQSMTGTSHNPLLKPVRIAPGTYWVGKREPGSVFFANPYLRVFEPKAGVDGAKPFNILIDPGSSSDFAIVRSKVESILGEFGRLSSIFINHQDPDVGSSTSTILSRYAKHAVVLTSEETWRLVVHTNIPRKQCVLTDRYPKGVPLPSGDTLIPVPSPFCHFVGAVMLYDPQTRVLFSGDLFGGLTPRDAEGFLATEADWTGIRAFHQLYMPSNVGLRRAVANIRALDPPVEMIAPQHGRLLRGDIMYEFMERIENLSVGLDNLEDRLADPEHLPGWNSVLERVLETVVNNAGDAVFEVLLQDPLLRDDLRAVGSSFEIVRYGKSTLERVVRCLSGVLEPTLANIIYYEAIAAAEDLDLPVPKVTLEESGGMSGMGAFGTAEEAFVDLD